MVLAPAVLLTLHKQIDQLAILDPFFTQQMANLANWCSAAAFRRAPARRRQLARRAGAAHEQIRALLEQDARRLRRANTKGGA